MAIHRNGDLAIECDECGEISDGHDPNNYQGAWAMLKEQGWRAFRKDNGLGPWQNTCPDCVKAWVRDKSGVDEQRAAIGRKRREYEAREERAPFRDPQTPRDPPRRADPRNPPPRRRNNERPPWD